MYEVCEKEKDKYEARKWGSLRETEARIVKRKRVTVIEKIPTERNINKK